MTDKEWKELKLRTSKQSRDYQMVVKNYRKNNPSKLKEFSHGKYLRIEVEIEPDMILTIYTETDSSGEKSFDTLVDAYYVCFNDTKGTAFKNELLKSNEWMTNENFN